MTPADALILERAAYELGRAETWIRLALKDIPHGHSLRRRIDLGALAAVADETAAQARSCRLRQVSPSDSLQGEWLPLAVWCSAFRVTSDRTVRSQAARSEGTRIARNVGGRWLIRSDVTPQELKAASKKKRAS